MGIARLKKCSNCLICFLTHEAFLGWFAIYLIIFLAFGHFIFLCRGTHSDNKTLEAYLAEIQHVENENAELLAEIKRLSKLIPDQADDR